MGDTSLTDRTPGGSSLGAAVLGASAPQHRHTTDRRGRRVVLSMPPPKRNPFDPYGATVSARAEIMRRLSEAENVLESYHHATDLLAEALQNAVDAIDAHTERESQAPRRLKLEFDAAARRFAVGDTGVGMSVDDLSLVFQPNVSFKKGALSRRKGRSRGEKGVGLSFLLLACDRLAIQTCNGQQRCDLVVAGAASWARGRGAVEPPKGWYTVSDPDELLGSKTYTVITLDQVDPQYFDRDLYGGPEDELLIDQRQNPEREPGVSGTFELEWILRTKTALGNTARLFQGIKREQPKDIDVELWFRPRSGRAPSKPVSIPYSFFTPQELLQRAGSKARVLDHEGIKAAIAAERTQNRALKYVADYTSRAGLDVAVYLFAFDGNAMAAQLKALADMEGWAPPDWQGFYVATRDMPTGIRLPAGVIATRGYERRMFMLLQYDALKLDVGRKTLAGGTGPMLRDIVRAVWKDVGREVRGLAPVPRNTGATQIALQRHLREALALDALEAVVPYLTVPDRPSGVAAVFHELLGSERALVGVQPLKAGVFGSDDAFVYPAPRNGADPLHTLFGVTSTDILDLLEADETYAQTAALAVVWTLDEETLEEEGVRVVIGADDSPATHVLLFGGVASREEPLPTIVLEPLLRQLS